MRRAQAPASIAVSTCPVAAGRERVDHPLDDRASADRDPAHVAVQRHRARRDAAPTTADRWRPADGAGRRSAGTRARDPRTNRADSRPASSRARAGTSRVIVPLPSPAGRRPASPADRSMHAPSSSSSRRAPSLDSTSCRSARSPPARPRARRCPQPRPRQRPRRAAQAPATVAPIDGTRVARAARGPSADDQQRRPVTTAGSRRLTWCSVTATSEAHVRICGGRRVRSPAATRQNSMAIDTVDRDCADVAERRATAQVWARRPRGVRASQSGPVEAGVRALFRNALVAECRAGTAECENAQLPMQCRSRALHRGPADEVRTFVSRDRNVAKGLVRRDTAREGKQLWEQRSADCRDRAIAAAAIPRGCSCRRWRTCLGRGWASASSRALPLLVLSGTRASDARFAIAKQSGPADAAYRWTGSQTRVSRA